MLWRTTVTIVLRKTPLPASVSYPPGSQSFSQEEFVFWVTLIHALVFSENVSAEQHRYVALPQYLNFQMCALLLRVYKLGQLQL